MTAVITGDIINSRDSKPEVWMLELKAVLNKYGQEPKDWEIFRGDSFQLMLAPQKALEAAILFKSYIKQIKSIDVRMGIGIGDILYQSEKITAANGPAFIYSGESFESLKKETLKIKSPWTELDLSINLMMDLASLTIDTWTPTTSRIIQTALENPNSKQNEIARILNKSQSTVSEGLKRGGFDEIQKMIAYYQQEINQKCLNLL
jgi:hypothetical protein